MHCNTNENYFTDVMGILHQKVIDFNSTFSSVITPKILIKYLPHASHDSLGHVGANSITTSSKGCITSMACGRQYIDTLDPVKMSNYEFTKTKLHQFNQDIVQTPQDHISIDLIGPYNTTSQGNSYALTAACNLTCYFMTTPIPDKKTVAVAIHLFLEIMLKFSLPWILHSDNKTEFKSKPILQLTQQLGIKKTYISPQHPQANGKLKSSHRLIKYSIWKFTIDGMLEWDELLPYATAALQGVLPGFSQLFILWMWPISIPSYSLLTAKT